MPNTNQPRLLSFTLDDWTVLGGRVSVSLQGGVAVLVGRNGAGKSAILEGFEAISLWAIGSNRVRQFDEDSIPKILEIEVLTPSDRKLRYRYELLFSANNPDDIDINNSANDQTDETQFSWNDLCQYIDGEEEVVWSTKAGFTTFNKHDISRFILGNTTSFRQANFPGSLGFKLPDEMEWIYSVLREIRLLGKIPVRRSTKRNLSLLSSSKRRGIRPISSNGLADILARKIFRRINTGEIDELEKVCQRIGLGSKITLQLQTFLSKEEFTEEIRSEDEEYIG